MKNKVLITIILSLFMIMFIPSMVSAASYYVCHQYTVAKTEGRGGTYGEPRWRYTSQAYDGTESYNTGGFSSNTESITVKKSHYAVYKTVDKYNNCSDEYMPEFAYVNFTDYKSKGVIDSQNKFDVDKYLSLKNASSYVSDIKTAYKKIPSNTASVSEISMYISSDIEYNKSQGLKSLPADKYDAWKKTLKDNMTDTISRDMYQPKYNLLDAYKNNDTENISKLEVKISGKTNETIKANETTANGGSQSGGTTHGGTGGTIPSKYEQCDESEYGWWKCAWSFLNKGENSEHQFGDSVSGSISEIRSMIFDIGNVIFILITAFLGVKYIWGGVDSKFSVKNSLVTLVVAAIVFYGWNALTDVLDIKDLLTGKTSQSGVQGFVGTVYNTVMYIINFAAVGGIIYIGIKYMMAGADGKAEMKLKGIPVIMGIIMVYGTVNLINFILKIIDGL